MRQLSDIVCNRTPVTMPPTCSVKDACAKMKEHRVGAVLVIDKKHNLVGIFTGRDAVGVLADGKSAVKTKLSDVMTPDPITMPPNKSAIDALRLMWDGGFRHVPLMEGDMLVGVISRGDFKGTERERLEEERELWEHMR
ncbi:MAG TPA: CBS domain-containing protein [Micropepsaceae bacterium]|nr:CBS domain-containing protein [Micropepsaceae bacterium]